MRFTAVCECRGNQIQAFTLVFRKGKCCSNYKVLYYSPQLLFHFFSFSFTAEVLSRSPSPPVYPQNTPSQTRLCLSVAIPFIRLLSFLLTNAQVWSSEAYDFDLLERSFSGIFLSHTSFPPVRQAVSAKQVLRTGVKHLWLACRADSSRPCDLPLAQASMSQREFSEEPPALLAESEQRRIATIYWHCRKDPRLFLPLFLSFGNIHASLPCPEQREVAGSCRRLVQNRQGNSQWKFSSSVWRLISC